MFYGSQTGTSEGFAGRLAKDARRFGMPSMIYDPEDCTEWVRIVTICMYGVSPDLMTCLYIDKFSYHHIYVL